MENTTVIGRTSFIRGRVSGAGDLEISGRVEGDVAVTGEVVIESTGLVASNVTAARIVVRGAVKGDLIAEEVLVIESGARVVGDLRAPRIAIAQGGLVRGHAETGPAVPARPRAGAAAASARVSETKLRPVAAPAVLPPPPRAPKVAPLPPPPAPSSPKSTNHEPARAALTGARIGPPAPVVPVLKKGTKAIQKKQR